MKDKKTNKIIIVCGATASGKTALAIDLAERLNTEIISADSMCIYRGLNIGTAKPTAEETARAKHHMVDIVEPNESFSVGAYSTAARAEIEKLHFSGKIPIICGGTGFYIYSLLYDFSYGYEKGDESIREKYMKQNREQGAESVFEELKKVDPETAEKLHVNDVKRVVRALEIYYGTGKKKSEQYDELVPRYDYTAFMPNWDRKILYDRINRRVDVMFENGLVDEVRGLLDSGITENCQCMQGIGYKEVAEGLRKGEDEETIKEKIRLNTRHYAKRQITFFKRLEGLIYLDGNGADEAMKHLNAGGAD